MNNLLLGTALSLALLCGGVAQEQMAKENVSAKRHPNLAAAQRHIDQALNKIEEAQRGNEFDLGGHAAKAKELLDQANKEIKQAAEFANQEHNERK
jgi:formate dehydrogenase assembly factor FdhD